MKKNLGLILIFAGVFFLVGMGIARADLLEIGARVSLYNPPEAGASTTLLYGLGVNLNFSPNFSLATAMEYTSYGAVGHSYSLMPITADLIYHFIPFAPIDPYLGIGVGYYKKTKDGLNNDSGGGQARAGVSADLYFFDASLEVRYLVPDFKDPSKSSFSYGASLGGTFFFPL